MTSPSPIQENVPGGGGPQQLQAAEEGGLHPGMHHLTGQMLGFRFMVSLFLVHAEEGGPVPQPRWGGRGSMGCLRGAGRAVACVR